MSLGANEGFICITVFQPLIRVKRCYVGYGEVTGGAVKCPNSKWDVACIVSETRRCLDLEGLK